MMWKMEKGQNVKRKVYESKKGNERVTKEETT